MIAQNGSVVWCPNKFKKWFAHCNDWQDWSQLELGEIPQLAPKTFGPKTMQKSSDIFGSSDVFGTFPRVILRTRSDTFGNHKRQNDLRTHSDNSDSFNIPCRDFS
eukprot:jgi/Bigna1/65326/fgenesh1_kg.105_\